jgi:hypothetical protein
MLKPIQMLEYSFKFEEFVNSVRGVFLRKGNFKRAITFRKTRI